MNVKRIGLKLAGGLMAAAVAATAMVAQTGPVAAAPPEVTASENPVVVPLNQNTKNITLSWNLGNAASKAVLTVKDNAQTPVLTQGVATVTGSVPLTVAYGKTYTAQLANAASPGQTLGSALTITTVRPANNPNGNGCAGDLCISSVTFDPKGTHAPFTVKTSKAAHFTMEASTAAPLANGTFAKVDSAMFNLANVTQWNASLLGLEENTTYHYIVKATDAGGQVAKKAGTFKTLHRKVDVTYSSIHVTEDSDLLSACDCAFWVQAGNLQPLRSDFMYVNSGETVHPNIVSKIDNPGDTLRIRIEAMDNDDEVFFDACPFFWQQTPDWTNGSDACLDWTTASKTVDVTLSGMQESKTDTYTLTGSGGPVKFTSTVKVKVYHAP